MNMRCPITPELDEYGRRLRRVRSFVRRGGRLTKGQQAATDQFWSSMGIEYSPNPLDFKETFERTQPVVFEIGFGMGEALVATAKANLHENFLGAEVHEPGVGACLKAASGAKLDNIKVICHDAVEVLTTMIPDNSLQRVQLFFPDPWHKARHNKRRIVQIAFAELVLLKLKSGGILHMATDWDPYAEHMLSVVNSLKGFKNFSENKNYVPRPATRPLTKFEQRGQRLGHPVRDIMVGKI